MKIAYINSKDSFLPEGNIDLFITDSTALVPVSLLSRDYSNTSFVFLDESMIESASLAFVLGKNCGEDEYTVYCSEKVKSRLEILKSLGCSNFIEFVSASPVAKKEPKQRKPRTKKEVFVNGEIKPTTTDKDIKVKKKEMSASSSSKKKSSDSEFSDEILSAITKAVDNATDPDLTLPMQLKMQVALINENLYSDELLIKAKEIFKQKNFMNLPRK